MIFPAKSAIFRHIDGDGAVYVIERLGADNRRHEGADVYLLQFGAEGESVIANLAHAARQGHVFEVGAAVESGVSNLCNAFGDGEVLQLVAVVERPVADAPCDLSPGNMSFSPPTVKASSTPTR